MNVTAQRIAVVQAEYTYVTSLEMSVAEAKRIATERAKIQALADEFGTTVSQTNSTHINNSSTSSTLNFLSIGNSEVKGEWLADTKEPIYVVRISDNDLIVKVTVCGRAREIVTASIDISARLLRNGKEQKYESSDFCNGDDLFLAFSTPIDGYLAIYLIDESSNAYRLLPYSSAKEGAQEVKAGIDYLFFDNNQASTEQGKNLIDELTITTDKTVEHNEVYILFSTKPFIKPYDKQKTEHLPNSLSSKQFHKWLAKNRSNDNNMIAINKVIKITGN